QTDRRLFLDQIDTPIQTQKSEKNAIPSQPLRGLESWNASHTRPEGRAYRSCAAFGSKGQNVIARAGSVAVPLADCSRWKRILTPPEESAKMKTAALLIVLVAAPLAMAAKVPGECTDWPDKPAWQWTSEERIAHSSGDSAPEVLMWVTAGCP
ncbi:MAG TPA: hypothetical protein VFV49_08530, partial [Thermoanaerobaculia bacterium]|nr:hypothetical protein [Thermoanaerobaculia bacterium]